VNDDETTRSPTQPNRKPWQFTKDDPRRSIGRPAGLPNKKKRMILAKMEAACDEIVDNVIKMTKPTVEGEQCIMCGRGWPRPEETLLKASFGLMDRSGYGPQSKVEVSETSDTAWLEYTTAEEAQQILQIVERARTRMPAEAPSEEEEAVH
jgi:hypothetical protein